MRSRSILLFAALIAGACGPAAHKPSELPPPPDPRASSLPVASSSSSSSTAAPSQRAIDAVAPPMPSSPAVELAVGMSHACVRTANGEIWCWGHGDSGELGDGRRGFARVPRKVPLPQKATHLSSGDPRCAILADATVACWGGWSKEYGDRNAAPVRVIDGLTDIVSVSSGYAPTRRYYIRRDGAVFETEGSKPPVPFTAVNGAEEIVQDEKEVCARMKADKSVRCWHWDMLPDPQQAAAPSADANKPKPKPKPKKTVLKLTLVGPAVVPSLANATSLGERCAVMADRTVRCWGENHLGLVGDGTSIDRANPTPVVGGVSRITQVSRGGYATCATALDGSVRCWGDSSEYPVIPGNPRRLHSTPVVIPSLKGVAEVRVAIHHSCARFNDGRVACWGRNQFEEIGDGSKELERPDPSFVIGFGRPAPATDKTSPAPPPTPSGAVAVATDVDAGANHTCVRLADGSPRCWGKNDDGQLGDGTRDNRSRPTAIPYLTVPVSTIRAGWGHTCAILGDDAGVSCWGYGLIGELGQGDEISHRVPVKVQNLSGVKQIAVGGMTCALLADATVKCWGDWDSGAGDPSPSGSKSPTIVNGATGIVEIAATGHGACGRTAAGDVKCFGWGPLRELSGGRTPKRTAMPVRGIAHAKSLAAGGNGSSAYCAVVDGGNVMCWGQADSVADVTYVSGPDGAYNVWVPVRAKGYDKTLDLALGQDASCARNESKELSCWQDKKLIHPNLHDVAKVTLGESHACALLGNGEVWCWGKNDVGQLGDGTTTDRATPVRVQF